MAIPQREPDLDRLVCKAMQSLGWLIPTTPEEVAQAEAELEKDSAALPDHLREPGDLFEGNLSKLSPFSTAAK